MDTRFLQGIRDFNQLRFFEAHEVLEDLWHEYREADRTFLQGLIQLAAGFYHLDCGNLKGARSQLSKGIQKLERYQPSHHRVNVHKLLVHVRACLTKVEQACPDGHAPFDNSQYPSIDLIQERFH